MIAFHCLNKESTEWVMMYLEQYPTPLKMTVIPPRNHEQSIWCWTVSVEIDHPQLDETAVPVWEIERWLFLQRKGWLEMNDLEPTDKAAPTFKRDYL